MTKPQRTAETAQSKCRCRPLGNSPFGQAQPWTFTAEVDGRLMATRTIMRHPVAENVRIWEAPINSPWPDDLFFLPR